MESVGACLSFVSPGTIHGKCDTLVGSPFAAEAVSGGLAGFSGRNSWVTVRRVRRRRRTLRLRESAYNVHVVCVGCVLSSAIALHPREPQRQGPHEGNRVLYPEVS